MVLQTHGIPHQIEEAFSEKDRTEIHRMITELRHSYLAQHTEALTDYNKAERESNRKLHEVTRLEKHIERIEAFCKKNNIPITNVFEEK
ncbi:MAG: hypothetical protein ACOH18_04135 [Candidatus Saccharimonadaceae bacterium]